MIKPKVLHIDENHPLLLDGLESLGYQNILAYDTPLSKLLPKLQQYRGVIVRSRFPINKEFLDKAVNLKFIARVGAGLENIDISYAEKMDVDLISAPEGNRNAVGEHALGMLLGLMNKIRLGHESIRDGFWLREKHRGWELEGKTVGIIGYGNNGSAFAQLLRGFNVTILAYDKYLKDYSYKSTMESIFKYSDIVSLHIPLLLETKYLVDDNFINSFKKDIYLINTARGKCANTKDLVVALESGKIKGACLDVLEYEKTSFENLSKEGLNSDMKYLIDSKSIILSPHIAGWTQESNVKIAKVLFNKFISDFPQ